MGTCEVSTAVSRTIGTLEEDAGKPSEMRLGVDTAGEGELTGLRRKLDAVEPTDQATSIRDLIASACSCG